MNSYFSFSRGFARIALCIVFVWFGILKVLELSPATPLVLALFDQTLAMLPAGLQIDFSLFSMIFGAYEVLTGIAFLFPKITKFAIALYAPHLIVTSLPLVMLPEYIWTGIATPTLEGQYIIKNVLLIAAVLHLIEPCQTTAPQTTVPWKSAYGTIQKSPFTK